MSKTVETRVCIQNVRVLKPDDYRLKSTCRAYLDLRSKKDGAYVLWLVIRSAHDKDWTKPFMGKAKFELVPGIVKHEQVTHFLRRLILEQNARVAIHDLDPQSQNTCVSLMYDEKHQSVYMAIKGDRKGMDNTKNPKIAELLPFFEQV